MDLEKYQALLKERLSWGKYATFVPNKQRGVYNWFYFKEGFSKELADYLLDLFKPTRVLDPFCGSGTTLLACKQRGIGAAGFDAMSISAFAAYVKTRDYDVNRIAELRESLLKTKFQNLGWQFPDFFRRYFSKYVLDDVAVFLHQLEGVEEPYQSLFRLALINAGVRCSWAFKDGAVLKIRKHGNIPLRRMLARVTAQMMYDLRTFETKPCEIEVKQGDARQLDLQDGSVDAIITSPPYLNNIDYTKVYSIENWFVGVAEPAVRSFIGMESEAEDILGLGLPASANIYFRDMQLSLREMSRVCAPGAKASVVVANAYFLDKDLIVDSDLILSALAEQEGFRVSDIFVLNKRHALEKRTIKKGILRESMIVMEKL